MTDLGCASAPEAHEAGPMRRWGWYSALCVPGWESFPRATRYAWIDEPADAVFAIRTGDVVTEHRVGHRITWRTSPDIAQRAWQLVALLHWHRLAHTRGGYA